jgi:hypothetical protein
MIGEAWLEAHIKDIEEKGEKVVAEGKAEAVKLAPEVREAVTRLTALVAKLEAL